MLLRGGGVSDGRKRGSCWVETCYLLNRGGEGATSAYLMQDEGEEGEQDERDGY